MNKKQLLVMLSAIATLANCANAQETFRTLAAGTGIYQSQNAHFKPAYGVEEVFGHDLVSAALGVPLADKSTNHVLALQIDCDSTTASLVVFDKVSSNNIATIATSTSFDVVRQQDVNTNAFPNRERFVAQFAVTPTNNLLGGFLTIAGRLQLDPTTGCPRAIRVQVDKLDRLCQDVDRENLDDPGDKKDILRAGIGHAVGTVDLIFDNGTTNKVLLPFEAFSIRRQLD
jgi:hypothetical protein